MGAGRQGRLAFVLRQPRGRHELPLLHEDSVDPRWGDYPDFYSTIGFKLDQREDGIKWAMHN